MMSGWDLDDWIIMALVVAILVAGTIYIFIHDSDMVFGSWCGLVVTVTGVFHWLRIRDDKETDK